MSELVDKKDLDRQVAKSDLLMELTRHIGRGRAISMPNLAQIVFKKPINDQYNQFEARLLRRLITELRRGYADVQPVPIASVCCSIAGGYYIATGNELEDYIKKLEKAALKKLHLAASLRRRTLPELLGQLALQLQGGDS